VGAKWQGASGANFVAALRFETGGLTRLCGQNSHTGLQQAEIIAKKKEVSSDLIGNPTLQQKFARRTLDVLGQNGDASFF
jgi:hypothetical protein